MSRESEHRRASRGYVDGGKPYLAAILDLFSRFVVGWAISAVNDRRLTLKALEMAPFRSRLHVHVRRLSGHRRVRDRSIP